MCVSLLFQGHFPAALAGFNKNTRIVGDIVADIGRGDAGLIGNILDAGSPFANGFLDLVQITSGSTAAFLGRALGRAGRLFLCGVGLS